MRNFNICQASRPSSFGLMRLLVVVILCSFHLTVFARVIDSKYSKLDVAVLNDSISNDLGFQQEGHSVTPRVARIPITKRAGRDELTREAALKKGNEILDTHRERLSTGGGPGYTGHPGGSAKAREILKSDFTTEAEGLGSEPNEDIQSSLINDGISIDDEKWFFSGILENNCKSTFTSSYIYDENMQEGVIIVEFTDRQPGAALPWSEVAFQEYQEKVPGSVPKNLKYIYHIDIININTKRFISEAIERGGGRKVKLDSEEWHVFLPGSESFTVLLGSENGRGAGHLVNDHLAELGRKQVSEVHVSGVPWLMKIVLGPVPDS